MDSQMLINTMEILETKPLTDLVSESIIKVCYVSDMPNRNNTVITKDVGKEIAATLPGAPVVGFFNEESNDFVEHSRKIVVENGEVRWKDLTRPYGFVSPIDPPWFQDFIEDGFKRTYLLCKAFLWTRQYQEAALASEKGQSMELNENDMSGYYEGDIFIFTHATLDRLCILGDNYEPCFEGAKIMTTYSKEYNDLAKELENIIGRRYYVLNDELVEKAENTLEENPEVITGTETETEYTLEEAQENSESINDTEVEAIAEPEAAAELSENTSENIEEYTVNETSEEPITEPENVVEEIAQPEAPAEPAVDFSVQIEELQNKVTLLENSLAEKNAEITSLTSELNSYKAKVETIALAEKNEMIDSYKLLLTEEEINPVAEKISELSLDDIEAKLSVTYARKQKKLAPSTENLQVNINNFSVEDNSNLPDFMKQALEYERNHTPSL